MIFAHSIIGALPVASGGGFSWYWFIGSIIPDIDHVFLVVYHRLFTYKKFADAMKYEEKYGIHFKTRYVHSILGLALFTVVVSLFASAYDTFLFGLAYFIHLLLDYPDTDKKQFLYPISRRFFSGFLVIWSRIEQFITVLLILNVVAVWWAVIKDHFSLLNLIIPFSSVVLVAAVLVFWRLWFLRDPERLIPEGRVIVSPADGRVVKIEKYDISLSEPVYIPKGRWGFVKSMVSSVGPKGYIISIFMSPLDVHVNRAPIEGKVIEQKHSTGRFMPADRIYEALVENEKNEILIKGALFSLKMIQVAGALARRIENFVTVGQDVSRGERVGLINLGSQCSLIIPEIPSINLQIKVGDKMTAGSSIIAKY